MVWLRARLGRCGTCLGASCVLPVCCLHRVWLCGWCRGRDPLWWGWGNGLCCRGELLLPLQLCRQRGRVWLGPRRLWRRPLGLLPGQGLGMWSNLWGDGLRELGMV